jgi:hypothetical protein
VRARPQARPGPRAGCLQADAAAPPAACSASQMVLDDKPAASEAKPSKPTLPPKKGKGKR